MFINNVLFLLAGSYTKQDIRDIINRTGWICDIRWRRKDGVTTLHLNIGENKTHFSYTLKDSIEPDEFYLEQYVLLAITEKEIISRQAESAFKILKSVTVI